QPSASKKPQIRLPALQPLSQFAPLQDGAARFHLPDLIAERRRCLQRVRHNLLLYQTNYLLCLVVSCLLMVFCRPIEVLLGFAGIVGVALLCLWLQRNWLRMRLLLLETGGHRQTLAALPLVGSCAVLLACLIKPILSVAASSIVLILLCLLHALLLRRRRHIVTVAKAVAKQAKATVTPMDIALNYLDNMWRSGDAAVIDRRHSAGM
uniref:PRA1 family protein n=2 Tax=Macrostomum lignano TaxID=282301 RepID=A0A1I8J063_9PLAT